MKSFPPLVCLVVWVVGVVGCATPEALFPFPENIIPTHDARVELASRQFVEHPDQADFETAQTRWLEGDATGCLDQLYQVVEREPDHLDARLLLVESLLAENRVEEAKRKIRPAMEACPEDERTRYLAALLLDTRMNPNGAAPRAPLADVKNESVKPIRSNLNPMQPERIEKTDGRMPSDADEPTVLPAVAEFSLNVADKASSVEKRNNSEPIFSISKKASTAGLVAQGRRAFAEGEPDLAMGYFRAAVIECPNNPKIFMEAALLSLQSNRPSQAIEFLEPAQKLSPRSAAIPRILGTAYYRLGDYAASKVSLDKSLSLDKSNALSYFLLGCTNVKLGHRQSASRYFRLARMLDRGNSLE